MSTIFGKLVKKQTPYGILAMCCVFVCLVTVFVSYIFYWNSIGGDAAVYLPYAKHMFSSPFSFGPKGNVAYGATSPLWAIVISIFHFGSDAVFFSALKIANVVIIAGSIYLIARRISLSIFITALFLFLHTKSLFSTFLLYEYSLMIAWIALILHFEGKKKFGSIFFLTGFLPLVRPEMSILQFAILLVYWRHIRWQHIVFQIVPYTIYALYMYYATGMIVPSSIMARILRYGIQPTHAQDVISRIYRFCSSLQDRWVLITTACIGFFYLKNRIFRSFSISIFLYVIIIGFSAADGWRYDIAFAIMAMILVAAAFQRWPMEQKHSLVTLIVVVLIFLVNFTISWKQFDVSRVVTESRHSTFEIRLVRNLADYLNEIMGVDETVLIYEIAAQYYLERKAVALDGIIGGQALLYMYDQKRRPFNDFVRQHNYYAVTEGFYRREFKGSIIELLNKRRKHLKMKINESIRKDGIIATKIHQLPSPWRDGFTTIFKIENVKSKKRLK